MFGQLARRFVNRGVPAVGAKMARPSCRPQGERLVFVGGAPRSGTTLLQHILDCHPDVFGGPEFDCIPTIVESWRRVRTALERGRITVFCTRQQIDESFAALVERLLLPAADACRARLLSEKTPFNALVFGELLELLPCCRAVHIVRDPRAVLSSLLKVGDRHRARGEPAPPFTTEVGPAIDLIRQSLDSGHQAGERSPQRLLTVSYEALVAGPETTVRQVCAFLGIDFHPAMLAPHRCKHPGLDEIVKADNGTWLDPDIGLRPIEASRVDAWRKVLDAAQVAAVNAALGDHPLLRSLGYHLD